MRNAHLGILYTFVMSRYREEKFIKSVVEEYQVVKRERKYHGCGEEYNVDKKRKGKQYHLSYNIKAVCKNIKWERGEGDEHFEKDNIDFKNGVGEEYQVEGNFIHPWFRCLALGEFEEEEPDEEEEEYMDTSSEFKQRRQGAI